MVLEAPGRIDAAVDTALTAAKDRLSQVIGTTQDTLITGRDALTGSLDAVHSKVRMVVGAFSPTWLLNHVSRADLTADGLLHMAQRLGEPGDDPGATQLAAHLNVVRQEVLRTLSGTMTDTAQGYVLEALNHALHDPALSQEAARIVTELDPDSPFAAPLQAALERYASDPSETHCIRLNRLWLEAAYPDDIVLSLPSLHPYVVYQVAQLYPEETVEELDRMTENIIETVKQMPDQLIRAPLDDAFQAVKTVLQETFDLDPLFEVLTRKIMGLDDDLAEGLDRVSVAYNQLLATLDARLAA